MGQPTPVFLNGKILLDTSMVQSWLTLINKLLPFASGALATQLTKCQTEFTVLLALPIDPAIAVGSLVTPITYVNDLQNTLAVYQHEFSGYQGDPNFYQDVTDEVNSVMIQYSSGYYNGAATKPYIIY